MDQRGRGGDGYNKEPVELVKDYVFSKKQVKKVPIKMSDRILKALGSREGY